MNDWRADLGPIAPLVRNGVRDLAVLGAGDVWVSDGRGFASTGMALDAVDVRRIGTALIERGGGRVDDSRPIGDAALPGQIRVHLTLPPIARHGPLLSLRFPSITTIGLEQFRFATGADRQRCIDDSVLIVGVTGSGKTTLAGALLAQRPATDRIVIVEDVSELTPDHPHCVHLTSRAPNPDGGGAVSLQRLVTEALRMRPDSLVVGEIRGDEIVPFLAAVTAGHHGIATVHARNLDEVIPRLTMLCLSAGIPAVAIDTILVNAIRTVALCTQHESTIDVTVGTLVRHGTSLMVEPM